MRSIRDRIETGGSLLGRRLDQLRDALGDISLRLRSAIANAIGQSLGTVVRDTVLRVLSALQEPLHAPTTTTHRQWRDSFLDDDERTQHEEDGLWDDDQEQYQGRRAHDEKPVSEANPARLTVAVCVGLEAVSVARRFLGKNTLLSLLGIGLATGCIAYMAPTVAIAGLGLISSANHLGIVRKTLRAFSPS